MDNYNLETNSLNGLDSVLERVSAEIECHEDVYLGDRRMPAHEHPESHIVLCLGGVIEHHSNAESYVAIEKTVAYVPAHETHSNMFRGTVRTFQLELNEASLGLRSGEAKVRSLNQFHPSASLMRSIYREFKTPDKFSQLMLQSLATELLVTIHREEDVSDDSKYHIPWLMRVRDLLHEELSENLQLEDLAAQVGVHPAHLTKAFRKRFGQSIGEYVRELRIARARHLLESSDMSIGAIAVATGFVDQSHFTRTFRQSLGRTPNSYREQN